MKYLLLLLIIINSLLAQTKLIIDDEFEKIPAIKYMFVTQDKENILNVKDVLNSTKL